MAEDATTVLRWWTADVLRQAALQTVDVACGRRIPACHLGRLGDASSVYAVIVLNDPL